MKFICSLLLALVLGNACVAQDARQDSIDANKDRLRFQAYRARKARALELHKQKKLHEKEQFQLKPFDSSYYKGLALGTNIATLTDPVDWGPTFTAEYRFARRWSVGGSLKGILITGRDTPDKIYYEPPFESKGFRITANVKYFLPWAKTYKWFVGMEAVYKHLDYTVFNPASAAIVDYDASAFNNYLPLQPIITHAFVREIHTQYTVGGGPVFGVQHMIGRHFQFEWYMGIYLVHKQIGLHGKPPYTGDRPHDDVFREWGIGPFFPGDDEAMSRTTWDAKLPLGFRFSYCIGSRHGK